MAQYINKSALVAEMDSWRDGIKKGIFSIPLTGSDRAYATFEYEILGKVKDLLDTLEVKEVNDDKWIIKATEWLSANLHRYDESIGLGVEEFVERFKKAMGKPAATLLWHPADGDYLPEIDREVIVLLTNDMVCFAHRPNPNGWDGKSVTTGKVKHYTPKTNDKGGWNIPEVKYWLDIELPKE